MSTMANEHKNFREMVFRDIDDSIEHGIYVSNLARYMGKELQLSDKECYNLALAGLVHDIGKLRLSTYLYGDDETQESSDVTRMRYVRTHSKLSYEILSGREFDDDVLEIVLYHHENFDGSGYPANLQGEEIPYGARILRVCDVFVALISDRPYRKAFDKQTAIELMIDEVKNFDLHIFMAFLNVVNSIDVDEDIKKKGKGINPGVYYGIN